MTTNDISSDVAVLVDAVKRAALLLGLREAVREDVWAVLERGGVDVALYGLRWFGGEVTFYHEHRTSFRLSTSVALRVTAPKDEEAQVEVQVTWASGGGEPSLAFAALTHHMDALKKAATAEEILKEAVRTLSRRGSRDVRLVMQEASRIAERAEEDGRAIWEAHRAAVKAASAEALRQKAEG